MFFTRDPTLGTQCRPRRNESPPDRGPGAVFFAAASRRFTGPPPGFRG